ncbi:hypothetical protein FQN60_014094 [Etheostoma spectabile]|uniref:Uncharacterized protein n=1 Tax=Etheostoma spectabile TaxID=54343 RepID=A0A5J5DB63_9PERO|nr:hypothetical protein FQN60_014094 [Etheostoma spectabile]
MDCITVWYRNCSAHNNSQQRVIKAAQLITGNRLLAIKDLFNLPCLQKTHSITKDHHSNQACRLVSLLPSGRRYSSRADPECCGTCSDKN